VDELKPNDYKAIYYLTKRETDVFDLLITGLSDKEIAERLSCLVTTVRTHVESIFIKTGVKNRKELMYKVYNLK
jgi:DNA-binding NarL/FixJ family response regulator